MPSPILSISVVCSSEANISKENERKIIKLTEAYLQNSVAQHKRKSIKQDNKIPSPQLWPKMLSKLNKCNVNHNNDNSVAILKIRFEMLNDKDM